MSQDSVNPHFDLSIPISGVFEVLSPSKISNRILLISTDYHS